MRNLKMDLPLLELSQYIQLQAYYDGRPGVFTVCLGGIDPTSATVYTGMFADGGLTPGNFKANLRAFCNCKVDIMIIGVHPTLTSGSLYSGPYVV